MKRKTIRQVSRLLLLCAGGPVVTFVHAARFYLSRSVPRRVWEPAGWPTRPIPFEVTLFELAAGTPLLWEEQWGSVEAGQVQNM